MPNSIPEYADIYSPAGIYGPHASINHAFNAPYGAMKNEGTFEVKTGWISLPVAYNNGASVNADETVRIKLHATQYHKYIDYQASRAGRPPMVPALDNTEPSTMNPILSTDAVTGQQLPVLESMVYVFGAPESGGTGSAANFSAQMKMKYSVGKEKIFLQTSDFVSPGSPAFKPEAKLTYRSKMPNDGNLRRIPANIIPQYTFNAYVGPGYLEGSYVEYSLANSVAAMSDSYKNTQARNLTARSVGDPYGGIV